MKKPFAAPKLVEEKSLGALTLAVRLVSAP